MSYLVLLLLLSAPAFAQRKTGNALDHLPGNIDVLTHFGERADIWPDNQQVAFMDKSFGDAFVIDLKTRTIRCLTCNVPGASFLRVMHLVSGDYILIGPGRFSDVHTSRTKQPALVLEQAAGREAAISGSEDVGRHGNLEEEPQNLLCRYSRSGTRAPARAVTIVRR